MELQYFGANALRISTKKATIIIDDNLKDVGLKPITKAGDIALFTAAHAMPGEEVKLVIDQPGEYEVSNVSIQGVAARAHMDEEGQRSATIFKLVGDDDIRVAVLGHVYPDLDDDQLEAIGMVDVLVVPMGGNGYTLDATGAMKLIKEIEPRIVIPTHYADKSINYPVPQQDLDEILKNLPIEPKERVQKLKLKSGEFAEGTQFIILERA